MFETEIYSKTPITNWIRVPAIKTCFDAGDGIACALGSKITNLDRILISHDHTDHIGGLFALISCRSFVMGDRGRPLTVYLPPTTGSSPLPRLKRFIEASTKNRNFELNWVVIEPGMEIPTETPKKKIRCFPVEHGNPRREPPSAFPSSRSAAGSKAGGREHLHKR